VVFLRQDLINLYGIAKDKYKELGVNTDLALNQLKQISLSIHCWQGDDVGGFERPESEITGGGILSTGNYPGKARTIKELQMDLIEAISLIPGNHRVNLHASYGDFKQKHIDRNAITPEHFQNWIDWAKEENLGLDFNSTLFSHPKADAGYTLSNKSSEIRNFWIEHVQKCREISAEIGRQLNSPVIHNLWIPDGSKDIPVDRSGHRDLLKNSLDEIFNKNFNPKYMKDSLEGKLFGIGSEAFVVGSHDFYLSYAVKNNLMLTLDMGHFHPTESVADKISAILPFLNGIMLHVSRGVRWDSDHVVILNDDLIHLSEEIIRCKNREKIYIGLDFFDASINRLGAWVIGARSTLISLLNALLQPLELLKEYEENNQLFQRLAYLEEIKSLPFGVIWDYYCYKCKVPIGKDWIKCIEEYEFETFANRT